MSLVSLAIAATTTRNQHLMAMRNTMGDIPEDNKPLTPDPSLLPLLAFPPSRKPRNSAAILNEMAIRLRAIRRLTPPKDNTNIVDQHLVLRLPLNQVPSEPDSASHTPSPIQACPVCRALELARRSAITSVHTASPNNNNTAVFATARFRVRRRPASQPGNANATMTDAEPQRPHPWPYARENLPIRKQRRLPIKPHHLRLMVRSRNPQQQHQPVLMLDASASTPVSAGTTRSGETRIQPPGVCATHAALLRCATTPASPSCINCDEIRARSAHFVNDLRRAGRHDDADRLQQLQQKLAMMNHCKDGLMRANGGAQEEEGMRQIEQLLNGMDLADRAPETAPEDDARSPPV